MKKFPFPSSLRARVLILIFFAILPSFGVFYLTNQKDRNEKLNLIKEDLKELAGVISVQEADLINASRQVLITVSALSEVKNFQCQECKKIFSELLSVMHRYLNFGIADLNGNVLCTALSSKESINISDREYFKNALGTREFTIGSLQEERITHQPCINFAYPITGEDDQPKGIIFASLNLSRFVWLEERLAFKIPEDAILTKTDSRGIILARVPGGEDLIGKAAPETEVVNLVLKAKEGITSARGLDGHSWIYVFTAIKSDLYQGCLYLILGRPEKSILEQANHSFHRNVLIMSIVGILLVIGAMFGFRVSFLNQVQDLIEATEKLSRGNLNAKFASSKFGSSELNNLGNGFNQMAEALKKREEQIIQAYDSTIEGWSKAMDLRDKETEGHTLRVTELTLKLARLVGVSEENLIHIRRGALLHDIGKLGVPDSILLKPDRLTDEEWSIMRQHPQFAYDMLSAIEYLRPALDIPYCHHEKWDGSGYPRGLEGEEIPLAARLFAIVDVWDALHSERPYRRAWSKEKIIEYIKSESGKHFDPRVVELFLKMISEIEE